MIQFTISMIIFLFTFMFSQIKHPLSMGMLLLIQTLMISLLLGASYKTFWFSYTLFLIFIGGMLVMFIYVTSLSSNKMFSISYNLFFCILLITMLFSMIILLMDFNYTSMLMNYEMMTFNKLNIFINENSLNLNKLYNFPTNMVSLFLINYLFLTLIISVKITNFFYGPLRPSY